MLAMHDHDPGSSNFLTRSSYHLTDDMVSESVTKPQQYLHQLHHHHLHHHSIQQHHHQHSLHHFHQQHQRLPQHDPPQQPHSYPHHGIESSVAHLYHQSYHHPVRPNLPPQQTYSAAFPSSQYAASGSCGIYNEQEEFEDVDEEDISEMDDAELLQTYEQYRRRFRSHAPDVTSQLLHFAEMVSADIQKFFGRSKGHEDGCDVYEDKWAATKSGRELYYADLLRIAQGDTEPANKTTRKSFTSPSTSNTDQTRTSRYTGKRNVSAGIGPLSELFQFGLQNYSTQKTNCHSRTKGNHVVPGHKGRVTPMQERNLPASFWCEPCSVFNNQGQTESCVQPVFGTVPRCEPYGDQARHEMVGQNPMMATSKLPDFTDLVESWQRGGGGTGVTDTGHDRRHQPGSSMTPHGM
ncbi:protein PERCC1-like [Biomphalaria glabrata]|uniref:Protein PERCC1-like n=1 Tax=Biomphalaria glabrata TaxID=6526 RepID=A0A9W2ZKC7_BIOGL|nr:protein PERCC1-like [Biomphalaria glabrata]XP_055875381.1 protein PERCC1-like [Biomphalaria glabrata]